MLLVSFILATQTFLLYKLAVVFDDWLVSEGKVKSDVFIQQNSPPGFGATKSNTCNRQKSFHKICCSPEEENGQKERDGLLY